MNHRKLSWKKALRLLIMAVLVLMLLAGISAIAESELEQVRYTQVPGMPTQDFVLSFDETRNNAELVVTVQEPDQITKDALFAIYDFSLSRRRRCPFGISMRKYRMRYRQFCQMA